MTQHEKAFNYHKKRIGQIFGQPFSVYTVDYTAQDQTPALLFSKKFKVEVEGDRLVQSPLPHSAYYGITGDYESVNTGYFLQPLRTDTDTPPVTILSKSPFEEITGFRTSRLCAIYSGTTLIYNNVYFDFAMVMNHAGKSVHPQIYSSYDVSRNVIVMYMRALRTTTMDIESMLIKEIDVIPQVTWKVSQVTTLGNLMQFEVSMSDTD